MRCVIGTPREARARSGQARGGAHLDESPLVLLDDERRDQLLCVGVGEVVGAAKDLGRRLDHMEGADALVRRQEDVRLRVERLDRVDDAGREGALGGSTSRRPSPSTPTPLVLQHGRERKRRASPA